MEEQNKNVPFVYPKEDEELLSSLRKQYLHACFLGDVREGDEKDIWQDLKEKTFALRDKYAVLERDVDEEEIVIPEEEDGKPVVACDGGKVGTAAFSTSYGNYVIIDHGNGYQTLYAHMSGLAVSRGDIVTQGQTIGYLGATGYATGTHCHVEVFVNGTRVNPANYLPG